MSDNEEQQVSEKKRWYVVQVATGTEKYVQKAITLTIEQKGMGEEFEEVLVPSEQIVAMRAGQKRNMERKLFPSYVLVKMVMNDETWHMVKSVPKVRGFIGGERPSAITEKEAQRILAHMEEGADKPKPKTLYEVGEVVRVIEGPFVDFNGSVEEVNYEKNRLRVSVMIFGRSTPVELEFSQVEKA